MKPDNTNLTVPFWQQLRWKLIIAFVLLAIIPTLLVQSFTSFRTQSQATEQVFSLLETVTELKQNRLTHWVEDRQVALKLILANQTLHNQLRQRLSSDTTQPIQEVLQRTLQQNMVSNPFFDEIFLYDLTGNIVASSNTRQVGKRINTRPFFEQSLGTPYIQSPYYEVTQDQLVMVATHPITIDVNQIGGVLAGRVSVRELNQIMGRQAGLGETGETYLISLQSNFLLPADDTTTTLANRVYTSEGIDNALAGQNGSGLYLNYESPPKAVFGVYRWLPSFNAALLVEIAEADALQAYSDARWFSFIFAIITAAIAIIMGLLQATRITKPVVSLVQVASQIAQGSLNQQIAVKQQDEIGLLARAFNQMIDRLQNTLHDLNQRVDDLQQAEREIRLLNTDLETRVQLRTTELEHANKELESFAYSVSHDLRAPLRHIDGYAQLLLKREGENLDDTSLRHLNVILNSVSRMGQLIDDLLSFSRTGRVEISIEPVHLNPLVTSVQAELAFMQEKREIIWKVAPLPCVEADPALLRLVWMNLLSNAIKYSSLQPNTRIEIGVDETSGQKPYQVTIFVRDNGVGFDPQYGHKLFGVFQRLHQRDEFEGTGIGLATAQRIIQRHKGEIWAESVPNQGAIFYFTLKRCNEQKPGGL
ncbi:MAG: ATP-binding protein [Chloroflexota bacterium]